MSDVTFITSFRFLHIEDSIDGYVELLPGINISNDSKLFAKHLTNEFVEAAGLIEAMHLKDQSNLVFCDFSKDDIKNMGLDINDQEFPQTFLRILLLWVKDLFKNAWLLKDHAMQCECAYVNVKSGRLAPSWSNNYLAIQPTFSDGKSYTDVSMTIDELNK